MQYTIITAENYSDIERIKRQVKNRVAQAMKTDRFNDYATEFLSIQGREAIERFAAEYNIGEITFSEFPTDGKTRARLVPHIEGHYYFNARGEGSDGMRDFSAYYGVRNLVEFDGLLLWPSMERNKSTCTFCILNDCTDYRTYLPYDWENKNPAPQRVGTLTDKKMQQWHDWLLARREAAQQEMASREDEVQAFRRRIAAIDPATCQRYDVREYQGEIVRNGLCFSWKIIEGHVEQKIEVHYATGWRDGKDKLKCFSEMCEGKYVAVL